MSTTTTPPAAGTIVYDRTGREAKYVVLLPNGGHLVRPAVCFYSPDPEVGETVSYEGVAEWHEVFLKPPTEVLNAEVATLSAKLDGLREEIQAVRRERGALDGEIKARQGRLKQHAALAQLDDFIAGKITHFVVKHIGYRDEHLRGVTIAPFKEAMDQGESWTRNLKLLSLYGQSNGDLTWRINRYSDGSGSGSQDVVPCTSLEQAREIAVRLYQEQLAAWRADYDGKNVWSPDQILEHAKRLEQPIPQDAIEAVHREAVEKARRRLDEARKAVAVAEGDLSAALIGAPVDARTEAALPC